MEAIALDAVQVPLYRRDGSVAGYTLVSAADAEFVSQWRWRIGPYGYAMRAFRVDGRLSSVFLHRELLGLKKGDGLEVDHINRARLDNRRENLRAIPKGVNQQNRPSYRGSSSRFRGVSWHVGKKMWSARVKVEGKRLNLGYFASEEDAADVARIVRLRRLPYAVD